MDRYEGPARLEWWANHSIYLDMYDIDLTVTVDDAGTWRSFGRHTTEFDKARREGWDFLMGMDPYFSLAFSGEDRGTLMVRVDEAEGGLLTLSEAPDWTGSVSVDFGIG
jgi:hypothetical protein